MHCAGEASDRPHDRSAQAPSTLICDHSPGLAPTRKTRESRISRCDRAAQGAHRLGLRRPRYLVGTDQAGEEATSPGGRWSGDAPPHKQKRIRAWSDRLTSELLDDLQEWNDAWTAPTPIPALSKSAVRTWPAECRMRSGQTAGRCCTRWTARCSECIRPEAGLLSHGNSNCSATLHADGSLSRPARDMCEMAKEPDRDDGCIIPGRQVARQHTGSALKPLPVRR
jgi:hypothetical protein